MIKKHKYILILGICVLLFQCKEDNNPNGDSIILPTNFEVLINVLDTTNGQIELRCNADLANFYSVSVESSNSNESKNSTAGIFEFDVNPVGKYQIKARAHSTESNFIQENLQLDFDQLREHEDFDKGYTSPQAYTGYKLIWNDEFEGIIVNEENWNFEKGFAQNNELQNYVKQNASVNNGYLDILGNGNGGTYTSARLNTNNHFSFQFGRIDVRAKIPISKSMWPAIWLLGDSYEQIGWPKCGEIDIMEYWGDPKATVHGTIHWFNENNGKRGDTGGSKTLDDQDELSSEFHVYSIVWDKNRIKWYVDNRQFLVKEISAADMSELREKFLIIINLAIGGDNPGNPDNTTIFPSHMYVDYVRVFQKE